VAKTATSIELVLEDGSLAETESVNRESRLTRMIDRLETQRLCLELAARLIEGLPGPVLEIGLGKGRTYDHLRKILPDREIFVFDRALHGPAEARPPASHLFHGEFHQTLPMIPERITAGAALAHVDIGTDDPKLDAEAAAFVAQCLVPAMAPGAIVAADRAMVPSDWTTLPLPEAVRRPYYLYRI
jgi:hypothetical protein